MVGLRRDRKGVVALFDAMIFIVMLTVAATWLFVFTSMGLFIEDLTMIIQKL